MGKRLRNSGTGWPLSGGTTKIATSGSKTAPAIVQVNQYRAPFMLFKTKQIVVKWKKIRAIGSFVYSYAKQSVV